MTKRVLLASAIALAAAALHAQAPPPAWKTWRTKTCSMNYPADWTFASAGASGSTLLFQAPVDSAHAYRSNVALRIEDTNGRDLAAFVEVAEKELRTQYGEVTMQRSETERTPGEVHTFECTTTANGQDLRLRELVRVAGGKAFVLAFTADPAVYDEQLYLAEAMLNSFAIAEK